MLESQLCHFLTTRPWARVSDRLWASLYQFIKRRNSTLPLAISCVKKSLECPLPPLGREGILLFSQDFFCEWEKEEGQTAQVRKNQEIQDPQPT